VERDKREGFSKVYLTPKARSNKVLSIYFRSILSLLWREIRERER
jgi:hypothetical protein